MIEVRAVCKCENYEVLSCDEDKVYFTTKDAVHICLKCGAEMKVQVVNIENTDIVTTLKEYK